MGTNLDFGGDPAKVVYAPARGEVDYDDELLTTLTNLAGHQHNDASGGQPLDYSLVADIATLGAAAAGTADKPARGDHRHAHGNLAGTSYHSDYSLTSHVHAGYSLTGHTHTIDEITSGTLWELTTDATYGDNLRATITDPGTNETAFVIKESLMGAVQLIHGGSGAADDAGTGLSGPSFNFIQRNAAADGTGVDQLANGAITATASPSERWGDEGTDYDTFTYTRGDAYIYFRRYLSFAVPQDATGNSVWRYSQRQWNADTYTGSSYSRPTLANISFAVYPGDWSPLSADPWPVGMELNEDGDLFVRNTAEFGGHLFDFGTNNVDGGPQDGYVNPGPDPTGGIRATKFRIWSTPNDNDNTGALIYFMPDVPGRVGPVLPGAGAYVSASGTIWNNMSIDYEYDALVENAASVYTSTAGTAIISVQGSPSEAVSGTENAFIAAFSIYKDSANSYGSNLRGLFYSHGAKHKEVRLIGDNAGTPTFHMAHGTSYGGTNLRGEMVFSDTDFGFDYATNDHLKWSHYGNVTTGTNYDAQWGMAADYGHILTARIAGNDLAAVLAIGGPASGANGRAMVASRARWRHDGSFTLSKDGRLYYQVSDGAGGYRVYKLDMQGFAVGGSAASYPAQWLLWAGEF